jgi:hypothetical protein
MIYSLSWKRFIPLMFLMIIFLVPVGVAVFGENFGEDSGKDQSRLTTGEDTTTSQPAENTEVYGPPPPPVASETTPPLPEKKDDASSSGGSDTEPGDQTKDDKSQGQPSATAEETAKAAEEKAKAEKIVKEKLREAVGSYQPQEEGASANTSTETSITPEPTRSNIPATSQETPESHVEGKVFDSDSFGTPSTSTETGMGSSLVSNDTNNPIADPPSPTSVATTSSPTSETPKKSVLLVVPKRNQKDPENGPQGEYACGPTSLGMMFQYYGVNVSTPDLLKECHPTEEEGTTWETLLEVSKKYFPGTHVANPRNADELKAVLSGGNPCLIEIPGHYMVCTGYDEQGNFYFNDPWPGDSQYPKRDKLTAAEMNELFLGRCIILK